MQIESINQCNLKIIQSIPLILLFCFLFLSPLSLSPPPAFRCAYCYFLNPARKTRPQAPRLPEFSYERRLRAESRSPEPTPRSGTDTEESAPPSGGTEKHRYTDKQQARPTMTAGAFHYANVSAK